MSNRYVVEPPTSGEVVLFTTHGEIHIELWTREAPLACRNFIQLCMEGFYDNLPFHRVIAGFMIQAGGETQGESIYEGAFKDEFHSRLKFSHRGIVAMVNSKRDDNKTQFFITVDKTPWLDKKNTIFGKVANNTIYNVIRISECEVDKHDKPLMMPKILSTKIIVNPFDDIIPREQKNSEEQAKVVNNAKPMNYKVEIRYDESDEEMSSKQTQKRIISSHDALEDPVLSKESEKIMNFDEPAKTPAKKSFVHASDSENDEDFDLKMKKKVLAKKEIFIEEPVKVGNYNISFKPGQTIVSKQQNPEEEFLSLKKNLLKLKKNPLGTNNPKVQQETKHEETFLSPLEKLRYNYYQYSKKTKGKEKETLNKLNEFVYKIRGQSVQKNEWFLNKLKFSVDSARAYAFNKDLPAKNLKNDGEDFMIVDPNKRLKKINEDSAVNSLEKELTYENLLKISSLDHERAE